MTDGIDSSESSVGWGDGETAHIPSGSQQHLDSRNPVTMSNQQFSMKIDFPLWKSRHLGRDKCINEGYKVPCHTKKRQP